MPGGAASAVGGDKRIVLDDIIREALHKNLMYFNSPVTIGGKSFSTTNLSQEQKDDFVKAGTKYLKEQLKSIFRLGSRLVECLDECSVCIDDEHVCWLHMFDGLHELLCLWRVWE